MQDLVLDCFRAWTYLKYGRNRRYLRDFGIEAIIIFIVTWRRFKCQESLRLNPPPNSGSFIGINEFGDIPDHSEGVRCKVSRSEE